MEKSQKYIQNTLNEGEVQAELRSGEKTFYKDVEGWFTQNLSDMIIGIFAKIYPNMDNDYAYRIGSLISKDAAPSRKTTSKLSYTDSHGEKQFIPWDFNDVENAVKHVYLHTLKPKSEPLNEDNGRTKFPIEGIDGWYYETYNLSHELYLHQYAIYDDKGKMVGIWHPEDKMLRYLSKGAYPTNDNNKGEETDGPFENVQKAAKHLWSRRQKPYSFLRRTINKILKEEQKKLSALGTFALQEKPDVTDSDVEGWIAKYQNPANNQHGARVAIADSSGNFIAGINEHGLLSYERDNGDVESDFSKSFNAENTDSVRQAIRYVYLKTQKPISEAKIYRRHDTVELKGTDYYATMDFDGDWTIYTRGRKYLKDGENYVKSNNGRIFPVGRLNKRQRLKYKENNLGFDITDVESFDVSGVDWQVYKDFPFDIMRALKYVYVMRLQSIKESTNKIKHYKVGDIVNFKGSGYMAKGSYGVGGIVWKIYDTNISKNSWIGSLHPSGQNKLFYDDNPKSTTLNWDNSQEFSDDIMKALKYLYVKRQKPLNELEEEKVVHIPGIDNWYAMKLGDRWNIYDSSNLKSTYQGAIWSSGTLMIARPGHITKIEDRPDFVDNPIQAARYIYLRMQEV